ncbi:MAG TPA: co-chaperone GroES [Patescibacteria group bacterium]|nr:co-chaperone GroES [Patescibacteria group bacterium]
MAKINLKPTAGYVLIEPEEAVKQTSSGIVLPESHDEKPQKGKVLAVGPAEPCDCGDSKCARKAPCRLGDTVIYKKWGGNEYKVGEKELMFIKFEDIMAVEA